MKNTIENARKFVHVLSFDPIENAYINAIPDREELMVLYASAVNPLQSETGSREVLIRFGAAYHIWMRDKKQTFEEFLNEYLKQQEETK